MATASWTARALPAEVRQLRDAAAAFVAAAGLDAQAVNDVRLAVSEAISNAVNHAYADTDAGRLTVEVAITGAAVRVAIRDDGGGVRPRSDSPGAGLGLPLMARLADELDVVDRPEGGTEVRLRFARSA